MRNIGEILKAPHDRDELPGARFGHGARGQEESLLAYLHSALLHPLGKQVTDDLQRYKRWKAKAREKAGDLNQETS